MATPDDELQEMLARLQIAEFVYEQPAVGNIEYVFKHALTQEVAYGSVLIERRRIIHELVGQALEALHEARIEEHLSELAYHYRRTSNTEKAIDYLKRAAEQAADRSAVSEAETQLRDALIRLVAGPATAERDLLELELQTALGARLVSRSFGAPEREQPLRRAYELCERVGHDRETLAVLFQLGQLCIQQARFSEARTLAERAVTLADSGKDRILEIGAQDNVAECCLWSGDLRTARPYFARAVALCAEMSQTELIKAYGFDLWTIPSSLLGLVELLLGWPERGEQLVRRTIERARSNSHPYSQALGLVVVSLQRSLRGDPEQASECLIPARLLSDEYGLHEIVGWVKQLDGWSHFWQGERALGLAEMKEAIEILNSVGSLITSSWRLGLLAEMQVETGDITAADTLVKEAFETLEFTKDRWCESEVYRIAAKVALNEPGGDQIAAEGYLRRAIEIARNQTAKWWELRATTSLANLLRDTKRRDEARAVLGEIYNWFTEGYDLADLKDAKALLDELSC
jgi:tetratricopeptide (TPR) repeat protein